jgi:hypothetical protein
MALPPPSLTYPSPSYGGLYGGATSTPTPDVLTPAGFATPTVATSSTAAATPSSSLAGIPASGTVTSYGNLRFPADIDTIDYWLQFSIFAYSRENRNTSATRSTLGTITLPMPSNLQTSYQADYEGASLTDRDIVTREALKNASINMSWVDIIKSFDWKSVITETPALAARTALDSVGGPGAALALGVTRNPCLAAIYKGSSFRVHNFEYKFSIRSQAESDTLNSIIQVLKYAQAPDTSTAYSNYLFTYPDECTVAFHYPQYLFTIGPSVFQHVTVNYHGAGFPSYFQGSHAPVEVSLSIQIMETNIVTKSLIQANNY